MAREMKDSGIEWIGEIPKDWRIYPARYAFTEIRTKNSGGSITNALKFYNGTIIKKANFDANSDNYVAETITNYTVVTPDTIMINGLNLNYDLKSLRVGLVNETGVITSAYLAIYPNKEHILPKFATYLFKGYETKMAFHNMGAGIRKTLGYKEFKSQPVLFPPLDEQERIVAFLDRITYEIDSIIEKTRSSIEEYKKLKQSVITEAVTKGIRPNRKMKDSGIEWIGEIPEDWQITNLGALTETMRNGYVGPTKDLFCEQGIRYIQSLHIKDGKIDFSRHEYYVSKDWADCHPKISKNDILIVQTGDIGSVGLVTEEYHGCNCHALIIATPKTKIVFPEFLTYYLRSTVGKELLLYYKTGALLPHLNSGKIKFSSVCLPPVDEQTEIVIYLNKRIYAIDLLISKKEQLITELETYKKSLIYEYVTGKKEAPLFEESVKYSSEFIKALLMCRILELTSCKGRIHLQKTFFALDTLLNLFSTQYYRFEHGPYDLNIERYEKIIEEKGWLNIYGGKATRYNKTSTFSDYYSEYEKVFKDKDDIIQRICKVFNVPRTTKAEKIATLLAVWNDFLVNGIEPTDDMIIDDVMTNWTPNKANTARETWSEFLSKIRENNIVPKGYGKHTKRMEELANGEL